MGMLIVLAIVVVTSIWVYRDARSLKQQFGTHVGGQRPGEWLAFSLLLWIIGFPVYLIKRGSYLRKQTVTDARGPVGPPRSALFCSACGNSTPEATAFCGACGAKVA